MKHSFILRIKEKPPEVTKEEREALRELLRSCPEFKATKQSFGRKEVFKWQPYTNEERWLRDWKGHWVPKSYFVEGLGYTDYITFLKSRRCE